MNYVLMYIHMVNTQAKMYNITLNISKGSLRDPKTVYSSNME